MTVSVVFKVVVEFEEFVNSNFKALHDDIMEAYDKANGATYCDVETPITGMAGIVSFVNGTVTVEFDNVGDAIAAGVKVKQLIEKHGFKLTSNRIV